MKYSKEVEKAIKQSKEIALEISSKTIRIEHLFLALINDKESSAYHALYDLGLNIDAIKSTLKERSVALQTQIGISKVKTISIDFETDKILNNSISVATKMKSDEVNSRHIFFSILDVGSNLVSDLFKKSPDTYKILKMRLGNEEDNENEYSGDEHDLYEGHEEKSNKNSKTKLIDRFGTDFTKLAKEGKLDPVVGRKNEIKRISQILSRRKKNNPVLVGEPGCVDGDTIITIQKISDIGTHTKIEIDY